jgi:hypothetical protein
MNPNETPTWRPPPPPVTERRSYVPAPRRRHAFAAVEVVFVSASDNRREP